MLSGDFTILQLTGRENLKTLRLTFKAYEAAKKTDANSVLKNYTDCQNLNKSS